MQVARVIKRVVPIAVEEVSETFLQMCNIPKAYVRSITLQSCGSVNSAAKSFTIYGNFFIVLQISLQYKMRQETLGDVKISLGLTSRNFYS